MSIRRVISVGIFAVAAMGLAGTGVASAETAAPAPVVAPTPVVAMSAPVSGQFDPVFCVLGTYDGPGGGCRGGSVIQPIAGCVGGAGAGGLAGMGVGAVAATPIGAVPGGIIGGVAGCAGGAAPFL